MAEIYDSNLFLKDKTITQNRKNTRDWELKILFQRDKKVVWTLFRIPRSESKNTPYDEKIEKFSGVVGDIGFEPITSTTSMWRSSQMS